MTTLVIRSHIRPRQSPSGERRRTRSASTLSPMIASSAGKSVIEAAIAMSTTRIAPMPRLRKIVLGSSSKPSSASTTVMPEKNTVRPAVAPAKAMASSLSRPAARSSR